MNRTIPIVLGALGFLDAALMAVALSPTPRAQTAAEAPRLQDYRGFTGVRTLTASNLVIPDSTISVEQGLATSGGTSTTSNLALSHATFVAASVVIGPARPEGAIYHQVVDRYFDKDGQPLETVSATHVVDPEYCHGGRRQQDLIATIHDDQHGNVWFGEQVAAADVASAAAQ